jgi:hypothetical protein
MRQLSLNLIVLSFIFTGCKATDAPSSDHAASSPASSSAPKITCASDRLKAVQTALLTVAGERRSMLALAGLAEACPQPAALAEAVRALQATPPEQRPIMIMKGIKRNTALWNRACAQGVKVFSTLATVAPSQQIPRLWAGCKLDRFGFATAQEAKGTDANPLVVLYAQVLEEAQVPAAQSRPLLRAVLGLK